MKKILTLIPVTLSMLLVACGSGGGGGGGSPTPSPTSSPIPSTKWLNFGDSGSNVVTGYAIGYDSISKKIYTINSYTTLCSLSTSANNSTPWDCSISLPSGFVARGDISFAIANGIVYVIAMKQSILYLLSYNISDSTWNTSVQFSNSNLATYSNLMKVIGINSNTMYITYGDTLTAINIQTGVCSPTIDPYFSPSIFNTKFAYNLSNNTVYYNANNYLYSRYLGDSTLSNSIVVGSNNLGSSSNLSIINDNVYSCGISTILVNNINATSQTSWSQINPTSTAFYGGSTYTTGCDYITSGDNQLFSYGEQYSTPSSTDKVYQSAKYQL